MSELRPGRWTAIVGLLMSVGAAAEPMVFVRVDQPSGLERGSMAFSYSVEASRAAIAIEGSADRGDAYVGAVHRLTAIYAPLAWLNLGVEQSLKQPALDQLRIGMLSPEVQVRLDRLGLPVEGLGVYAQGRLRLTADRQSSLVGGLVLDRDLGAIRLGARLGFEATFLGSPEYGLRSELGVAWAPDAPWRLSAEAWGTTRWLAQGGSESDLHTGPALQYRWKALRLGLQLGLGFKARVAMFVVDTIVMGRVGVGF